MSDRGKATKYECDEKKRVFIDLDAIVVAEFDESPDKCKLTLSNGGHYEVTSKRLSDMARSHVGYEAQKAASRPSRSSRKKAARDK
jgi:hypothetical protein